jgi:hypothetical protein
MVETRSCGALVVVRSRVKIPFIETETRKGTKYVSWAFGNHEPQYPNVRILKGLLECAVYAQDASLIAIYAYR